MSRHMIDALPQFPRYAVVVGWDNPLQTFFLQVYDDDIVDVDKDDCIVWLGTTPGELPTLDALIAATAPYAAIPKRTLVTLKHEQDARTTPTPLQRAVTRLLTS